MDVTLLVVTACGFAKRMAMADVPLRRRGAKGVALSSVPVVAAIEVRPDDEVVLATAGGMVERVAVSGVPVRRRRVQAKGQLARGVRVITLDAGDEVVSVAIAPPPPSEVAPAVAQCAPAALRGDDWTHGMVGFREGERPGSRVVFGPLIPLEEIRPGGKPAVPREEWAQTAIHRASRYWCAHCGEEREDPEAVYACIDSHVAEVAGAPGLDNLAEAA